MMRLCHPWKILKVFVMLWLLTSCATTRLQKANEDTCAAVNRLLPAASTADERDALLAAKASCDAEKTLRDARDGG